MCQEVKRILILSANPLHTGQLRLSEEMRNIQEGLKQSIDRNMFQIEYNLATRVKDIRRAMLEFKPHIVHFCGHGAGEKGIVFENEDGTALCVSANVLADFFKLFNNTLECVVLNACYSEMQANEIAKYINYVIGMNEAISDKVAISFSVAFYDAVYSKQSYEFAYRIACNAVKWHGAPDSLKPVLKKKIVNMQCSQYSDALQLINSGKVEDGIAALKVASTANGLSDDDNLGIRLMLYLLYQEGIGVKPDAKESIKYLHDALELSNTSPSEWAEHGYRIYDQYHPSLEAAAFLSAALYCGYSISGQTCVGLVRIFYKFEYKDLVRKYAHYGAFKLGDNKCKEIYDKMIVEGY